MSYSNRKLCDRFAYGKKNGQALNMEIKAYDDGDTAIIGYGRALYAYRTREGVIYKFCRWYGYSVLTTQQLDTICGDYLVFSYRPEISDVKEVREKIAKKDCSQVERLRKGIVRGREEIRFSNYSITLYPPFIYIGNKDIVKWRLYTRDTETMAELIKGISEQDEAKIEFIKELAESGLEPRNHTDFDMDRLRRSKKQSEAIREARERYLQVFHDIPEPGIEHISDAVLIFGRKVVLVAKSDNTYARIVRTDSNSDVLLGNMIAKGKLHKKLTGQISENTFLTTLLDGIKRGFYPSDSFEYLPEGVKAKAVKMKLEQ